MDKVLLAAAILSCLVAATIYAWKTWGPGQGPTAPPPMLVYTTELGKGATEGTVDSTLSITFNMPKPAGPVETNLSAVTLQLLDEAGQPAIFGPKAIAEFQMRVTPELYVYEFSGSMPSKPGTYRTRFLVRDLQNKDDLKTYDASEPLLRVKADTGPPLRSGYVFSLGGELWILSTDGKRERRLTYFTYDGQYADDPAWSPDGQTLAFSLVPETPRNQIPAPQIWTMKVDGTNATDAASGLPGEALADPSWSPDGEYIYYSVDTFTTDEKSQENPTGPDKRIDRVRVRTNEKNTIAAGAQMPAVHETSGGLVYLEEDTITGPNGSVGQKVVRANPDGTGKKLLVESQSQPNKYGPRLSPDGKWVAYSAPNGEVLPGGAFDLLEFFLLKPKSAYAHDAAFDAFIAPGSGGAPVRLTTLNEDQLYPFWLDNSNMAFIGVNGIYKVTINAEGQLAGTPQVISPGARHSTLTWHGP